MSDNRINVEMIRAGMKDKGKGIFVEESPHEVNHSCYRKLRDGRRDQLDHGDSNTLLFLQETIAPSTPVVKSLNDDLDFVLIDDIDDENSEEVEEEAGGPLAVSTVMKPRLKWTGELHDRFLGAVKQLGGPFNATPKGVMEMMDISGLELCHVKRHLQKYRIGKFLVKAMDSNHLARSKSKESTETGACACANALATVLSTAPYVSAIPGVFPVPHASLSPRLGPSLIPKPGASPSPAAVLSQRNLKPRAKRPYRPRQKAKRQEEGVWQAEAENYVVRCQEAEMQYLNMALKSTQQKLETQHWQNHALATVNHGAQGFWPGSMPAVNTAIIYQNQQNGSFSTCPLSTHGYGSDPPFNTMTPIQPQLGISGDLPSNNFAPGNNRTQRKHATGSCPVPVDFADNHHGNHSFVPQNSVYAAAGNIMTLMENSTSACPVPVGFADNHSGNHSFTPQNSVYVAAENIETLTENSASAYSVPVGFVDNRLGNHNFAPQNSIYAAAGNIVTPMKNLASAYPVQVGFTDNHPDNHSFASQNSIYVAAENIVTSMKNSANAYSVPVDFADNHPGNYSFAAQNSVYAVTENIVTQMKNSASACPMQIGFADKHSSNHNFIPQNSIYSTVGNLVTPIENSESVCLVPVGFADNHPGNHSFALQNSVYAAAENIVTPIENSASALLLEPEHLPAAAPVAGEEQEAEAVEEDPLDFYLNWENIEMMNHDAFLNDLNPSESGGNI